ncbi:MAG: hypothetical protein AABW92_02130, partial [Nanoarchaeota archaeon]
SKKKKIYYDGIKKYLTLRNFLIAGIAIIIYLMFADLAKAILFMVLFVPAGTLSIKITRVLPQANLEIVTPCSFFLGYLYGWPTGVFFGVILGAYIWAVAYPISQFVVMNLFLNGLTAVMGYYFATTLGWQFTFAYFIGMGIRNVLFFGIGSMMGNPMENLMHTISAIFGNMVLFPTFMIFLYNVANII